MSKKTRILALVLTLVMLVGTMPLTLFAAEENEIIPATEAEETTLSVLDSLAAEATGRLYGGIGIPDGAKKHYDAACGYDIGSGSEKTNGIYVDSGWGDGSKSLIDTVDKLTGGTTDDTNTNITFNITNATGAGAHVGNRYYVASFNIKRGEAYGNFGVYRLRIRKAYAVTTKYNANGEELESTKSATETQWGGYPIGYRTSDDKIYVPAALNDTGKDIDLGIWGTETYTNFGFVVDFEADAVYYYVNGKHVATDSSWLGVTTSEPDEDGNYTVKTFDLSAAYIGINPMFSTNNPYGGEWAQYGKTTSYLTNNTAHVFDGEGKFIYENKDLANGVFKHRGNYYLYSDGMLVTDATAVVGDYTLEIDTQSGRIVNYYRKSATTQYTTLSNKTLMTLDGSETITAYRYAEDGTTVETYEIDAVKVIDYKKNDHFSLMKLGEVGSSGVSYYASEENLKSGTLTTLADGSDDIQFFYDGLGADRSYYRAGSSAMALRNPDQDFVISFDAIAGEAVKAYYYDGALSSNIPFLRARVCYEFDLEDTRNATGKSYIRTDLSFISIKIIDGAPYIYFGDENCGEFSMTEKTNFTVLFKMDETKGPLLSLYVNGELKGTDHQLMLDVGDTLTYNKKNYAITDHYIYSVGAYHTEKSSFDGHLFTYYPTTYYVAEEGLVPSAGNKYAEIDSYSVALADTIHMNFYTKLGAFAGEAGAYALITAGGKEQKIALNTLEAENGLYKITAKLSSIQMSENVSLKLFDADGNQVEIRKGNTFSSEYTYSVRQYAEYILANKASYSAEAIALVKAMLLYGAFAERHFTGEVDLSTTRALTNHERLAVQYGTIGLFYTDISVASNLFNYTENDHTADVDLTATATDTSKLGQVYLVLDSAIKVRIELNVTEAPEVVSGGVLHTAVVDGETKYYVDITGLTAKDLNTVNTVIVDGNVISVTALAVANAVVSGGNDVYGKTFTDLMKAMYLYYYYADAYVKSIA